MPSVHLPYINIVLDLFALLVSLIVFASCFQEFSKKRNNRARSFLFLLSAVIISLIANIVAWFGEGHLEISTVTVIANTVASCAGQISIIFFMSYLKENLYESSRAAAFTVHLFRILCVLSLIFVIGNAFGEYSYMIDEHGHWSHTENIAMGILHFMFPMLSLFTIILMAAFAKSSTKINRFAFILYTVFPVAGIILDYAIHGLSLTYVGLTVCTLVIYTSIYLKKQKLIEAQQNALMLSQINPHFIYNTLSTIAAMCDVSPTQAKYLTIDFSRYLRQNLSNLKNEKLIPFSQELEHVECYLKIEKARFREKLNILYSIQCKDFEIPPLSIQPLVENAVKHGITKKATGGTLKISTYDTESSYIVEIKDDGVGFDPEKAERHVGLDNVQSRIMAMCKGEVTIKSTLGVGTRVTIEIPKKRGKRR